VWNSLLSVARRSRAKVPKGTRIYAIGDVHGRADLLSELLERIDADLESRPVHQHVHVFLGDYIDRGPQSREVLDLIIARRRHHHAICLKGNHETLITKFLEQPSALSNWRHLGGFNTLLSYGITPSVNPSVAEQEECAAALNQNLPESHRAFLESLALSYECGDFFFVHAGVRPGVPLNRQLERDLLWIREDFLIHEADFDKMIVHGHTPVSQPDIRPNRINIDTGAYATGTLTCLVLEDDKMFFI
jgi:serine/threonine protein phosphatase 1